MADGTTSKKGKRRLHESMGTGGNGFSGLGGCGSKSQVLNQSEEPISFWLKAS